MHGSSKKLYTKVIYRAMPYNLESDGFSKKLAVCQSEITSHANFPSELLSTTNANLLHARRKQLFF